MSTLTAAVPESEIGTVLGVDISAFALAGIVPALLHNAQGLAAVVAARESTDKS